MARTKDIEMADSHKSARDKEGHNIGWPHYDRKGNCLCYCRRCFGPGGCIDRWCAGHNHANCANGHRCGEAACQIPAPSSVRNDPSVTLAALPEPTPAELYATHALSGYFGLPLRKGA